MTYRKLFLCLLAGSTLLTGALWWHSRVTATSISASAPRLPFSFYGSSFSGTFFLYVHPAAPAGWSLVHESSPGANLQGSAEAGYGTFGKFSAGSVEIGMARSRWKNGYYLTIPIWFVCVLFNGCTFALYKLMARGSTAETEKQLAGENAADSITDTRD